MTTLQDLDNLYKTTIIKLPTESRLFYCSRHLDKLQLLLINNADTLGRQEKDNIKEMIKATQDEIKIINNK